MDPLQVQIGGDHYKGSRIQHVEFVFANKIPYCEACALKYLTRHRKKNGRQDLEKARHYLQILLELDEGRPRERLFISRDKITAYDYCVANEMFDEKERQVVFLLNGYQWEESQAAARETLETAIRLLTQLLEECYPT